MVVHAFPVVSAQRLMPSAGNAAFLGGSVLVALLASCGGGGGGSGGGSAAVLDLVEASHGFGEVLPHQIQEVDSGGMPTGSVITIRSLDELMANVSLGNPVLPPTNWPSNAILPTGDPGNHFIYLRFTQPLKVNSVLDSSPQGQGASGLLGSVTVIAYDPTTSTSTPIKGRAFVGGKTYAGTASGTPPKLDLQTWVEAGPGDTVVAANVGGAAPGLGFPGTQSPMQPGAAVLLSPNTLVFIPDADENLATHETFPINRQLQIRCSSALQSRDGEPLTRPVLASATVGTDAVPPELMVTPPPFSVAMMTPEPGSVDVDPGTTLRMVFSEPLQPLTVGALPTGQVPFVSSSILVQFGPPTFVTQVPFTAEPVSVFDLSTWVLRPVFAFPGSGPSSAQCGTFSDVTVSVVALQVKDLMGNLNQLPSLSMFSTGEGPGLVNAPVAPDVIYAVRSGTTPGISVVDLNGFGQSTGNPAFDFTYQSFPKGNTNFPNNPNYRITGASLLPPLLPGTCTVDGGSAGCFTLTKDSSLNDLLITVPLIGSAGDTMIGQALDMVFNNARDPTGCQSSGGNSIGGNVCAIQGFKAIDGPNSIAIAPHPNPPALSFPPLCVQPFIGSQEPTSVFTAAAGFVNLLNPGDALGDPLAGIPPSGLLSTGQNSGFLGPDRANIPITACLPYVYRQQIGHFLYMIDRARSELVVLHSNRFSVLDRIPLPDPTDLAMGPNVDLLAVSNQNSNMVSFVDILPSSSNFHRVVHETPVGEGPRGIAWDPGNEDILVCNELSGSVSIISAFSLNVRRTVSANLERPFDLAITQRQQNFGYLRNVYFGWILNRNGDLTMYESGPSGTNGWGFDDTIGVAPFNLKNPKRIMIDINDLLGAVWVAHEDPLNPDGTPTGITGGAVSNINIDSSLFGQLPIGSSITLPQFRAMTLRVRTSLGPEVLTGVPTDIAFEDMRNTAGNPNFFSTFSAGFPTPVNGKSLLRFQVTNGQATNIPIAAKTPEYLFVAVPNSTQGPGVIDVIQATTGYPVYDTDKYLPGNQSIPCSGVTRLIEYWRQ